MVDAVGIAFLKSFINDLIKVLGGGEIRTKRFLDDHAGPATEFSLVKPCSF